MLEFLGCFLGPAVLTVIAGFGVACSHLSGSELLCALKLLYCITKLFAARCEHRDLIPFAYFHKLFPLPYSCLPPSIFLLTLVIFHTLASIPLPPRSLPWSFQTSVGTSHVCSQSCFYLTAVTLCAVGAITTWSVVCMSYCTFPKERDDILFCVMSSAPSFAKDIVSTERLVRSRMVEEPPRNNLPFPTVCFSLAVALSASDLPFLLGRHKPL